MTTTALAAAAGMSYLLYKKKERAGADSLKVLHTPRGLPVISGDDYNAYQLMSYSPSFVSSVTQDNYWGKILFLIHLTDLEVSIPPTERQLRRRATMPFYLTLVTTDNIDCLYRFQDKPRMLVFSKELLKRKDYVVNTRDIGPSSQNQSIIQMNPLLTYFPSQLFDLVVAIEKDKQTFLRRSKVAFHQNIFRLLFNEVIFVDPVLWENSNGSCYHEVIIDDSNLDADYLIRATRMKQTFPKISFVPLQEKFLKNFNFLVLLQTIQEQLTTNCVNLLLCQKTPAGELPIYSYAGRQHKHDRIAAFKNFNVGDEYQLQLACADKSSMYHFTCHAALEILKKHATPWKEMIEILNNPNEPDAAKELVYNQMIENGTLYRNLHFDEFEQLETQKFLQMAVTGLKIAD